MNETPNGPFPGYVAERTETHQQYIDRIFNDWLSWVRNNQSPVATGGEQKAE